MSNIMKESVSQTIQEYNRIQELSLTKQEQEQVVEGIINDQDVLRGYVMKSGETFLEFVPKHVSIIIGKRNSDDNKSNIMKESVSQTVQEYNRIQEIGLTEQEQEQVVEGILNDQDVLCGYVMRSSKFYSRETFLEFVSKHVNIIIGKRNSDNNK